jgi:hypothetical protein
MYMKMEASRNAMMRLRVGLVQDLHRARELEVVAGRQAHLADLVPAAAAAASSGKPGALLA